MKKREISDSKVVLSQIMLPDQANFRGTVHGGEIMKLMDSTAYVVAKKHCRRSVGIVTARVDELEFHLPIYIEDIVTLTGEMIFVGRSSMEVFIKVEVDHLAGNCCEKEHEVALTAFFTMVAVDENGKSVEVPKLELTSEKEKERFEMGRQRYFSYKEKNKIKKSMSSIFENVPKI